MAKYLDQTGLTYFWSKIKTYIQGSVSKITYTNENLLDTEGTVKSALDMLVEMVNELNEHNHNDEYVPLTRTVAGLALSSDITAADLTAKLSNASASAAGTMTSAQYTKLNALPTNATLESTYAKKSDISSVYKPAGSITPTSGAIANASTYLTAANQGKVYHVTAEFETDQYFIAPEAGKTYPAGTNIAIAAVETWQDSNGTSYSYKFDILAGFVDLSTYATKDELSQVSGSVVAITNAEIDTIVAS